MALIDISLPIYQGMVVFPGDEPFRSEPATAIDSGELFNTTRLIINTHTGTHVDAPRHFIPDGKTVDRMELETLIGPARVFDLSGAGAISADVLARQDFDGVKRALFKTSNSRLYESEEFQEQFLALNADAADFLIQKGIRLVGIDYLSIDPFHGRGYKAHHKLLGAEVVIIEGLNLLEVKAGDYELMALPLKLLGADGSPLRVVLRGM